MDRLVHEKNGFAERNLSALSFCVTKVNYGSSSVQQKRCKRRNLLNWDQDDIRSKVQTTSLFVSGGGWGWEKQRFQQVIHSVKLSCENKKELAAKLLITTRKNCEKIAANVKRAKTATHTLVVGELRPLGHARYIKILITWLRGFRDKLLELVVSFLGFVESRDKRSFPLLRQICNFVLKSSEAG